MKRLLIVLILVLPACSGTAASPSTTVQQKLAAPADIKPGILDFRRATMSDGTIIELVMSVASTTYLPGALARGWVVITPAAPGGALFFQGSERYIDVRRRCLSRGTHPQRYGGDASLGGIFTDDQIDDIIDYLRLEQGL